MENDDKDFTTITISKEVREQLEKLKIIPEEKMDNLLKRIVRSYKKIDK
jgi:hypothetical protein